MDSSIAKFVAQLREIEAKSRNSTEIVEDVRPLVKALVDKPTWLRPEHAECDELQGFGVHVLHEETDHRLAVFVAAWLPGRGIPPHDHGTWGVVGGIRGVERNTFWTRTDDGSQEGRASIKVREVVDIAPGDVICNLERDIHSVRNESEDVTLSLHVYGKHINHTSRFGFDPTTGEMRQLLVTPGR